jgi:hypothetical protein
VRNNGLAYPGNLWSLDLMDGWVSFIFAMLQSAELLFVQSASQDL